MKYTKLQHYHLLLHRKCFLIHVFVLIWLQKKNKKTFSILEKNISTAEV